MSTQQNTNAGYPSTSPTIRWPATMTREEFIARYVLDVKIRDLQFRPPTKP